MVHGEADFILYWRTLPWDHAPGSLFIEEAGGRAARLDGSPYRPGQTSDGLLIPHPDIWVATRTTLLEPCQLRDPLLGREVDMVLDWRRQVPDRDAGQ